MTTCPKIYGGWSKQHFEAKDNTITSIDPDCLREKDLIVGILYYQCCTQEMLVRPPGHVCLGTSKSAIARVWVNEICEKTKQVKST